MSGQQASPMQSGSTITVRTNVQYFVHPKHRGNPTENSCTWRISVPDEVALFRKALPAGFCPGQNYWAAEVQNGRLRPVGINVHRETLIFGKFVDGSARSLWHGYPADYRRHPQDRPPISVLQSWVTQGLLEKHHIAKISGGKQCNL